MSSEKTLEYATYLYGNSAARRLLPAASCGRHANGRPGENKKYTFDLQGFCRAEEVLPRVPGTRQHFFCPAKTL